MVDVTASVIIPAHNAAASLDQQLEALASQSHPPSFEVVVVANRCTDATLDVAMKFADRLRLRVITADEEASAAYARNVGASGAAAPYLLFCDADDVVGHNWVASMIEPLIGGRADFVGGLIQVDRSSIPDWVYRWRYSFSDQHCIRERQGRLPFVISAALGVNAEAFNAVGGFDPRFAGAGFEEVDLSRRLLRAGYRIGEAPEAVLTYRPRQGLRAILSQARTYSRGELTLAEKEGHLGACPSPWRAVQQIGKSALYQVFCERDFNPLAVYAKSRHRFNHWIEHRRWSRRHSLQQEGPSTQFDFYATLSTPIIGGLAFATDRAGDATGYAGHGLEPMSLAILERFLPSGGVFIDVGANIGVFSVAAAKRVGDEGQVLAFEPSPRAGALLTRNVERHGVAHIVDVRIEAVGDIRDTLTFRTYENRMASGFGEIPAVFTSRRLLEEATVPLVTLSEAVEGQVDMVKVDVGGFAAEVLQGTAGLFERSPKPVVMLEFNPTALDAAGKSSAVVLGLLPEQEWDLWLIDDGSSTRTPDSVEERLVLLDRSCWNHTVGADRGHFTRILATPTAARREHVAPTR